MKLSTPRMGAAITRLAVDNYGAFMAATYRERRDFYLIMAKSDKKAGCDPAHYGLQAISAHRSMMRALREHKREQRLRVAA